MTDEAKAADLDWTNWCIIYNAIQGAMPMSVRSGYMGRLISEPDEPPYILENAIEFESITSPAPGGGGISRSHRALPMELNAAMDMVTVPNAIAVIPLDGMRSEFLVTFAVARREAEEARTSITTTKPASAIITNEPPPLVGLNGGNLRPRR